jgi:hypothetical protein
MPTSAYAQDVKNTAGLQAYWRLNDLIGTVATDSWVNNEPGTITGGVSLKQPGALAGDPVTSFTFDGSTGYVSTATNILTAATNVTVELWFNLSSESDQGAFFKCGNPNGYGLGIGSGNFDMAGNHLVVLFENVRWIDTGIAITDLGWHHAALVLDGSGYPHVYLDGSLSYSDSTGAAVAPTGGTYVGSGVGDRFFGGGLQEVAFYTAALSSGTIATHHGDGITATTLPAVGQVNAPNHPWSAVDILQNLLSQQDNSTDPINPSEVTASFESAEEIVGVVDIISFKNVLHNGTYLWENAATVWGEFQWS